MRGIGTEALAREARVFYATGISAFQISASQNFNLAECLREGLPVRSWRDADGVSERAMDVGLTKTL